jgi:hypothetical protein
MSFIDNIFRLGFSMEYLQVNQGFINLVRLVTAQELQRNSCAFVKPGLSVKALIEKPCLNAVSKY